MFVIPPSTTTRASATARTRRARASSRVAPRARIFAIIESNSDGIVPPAAMPASTRTPGPAGRSRSAIRPGLGANDAAGSSAQSRTSIAQPLSSGGVVGQAFAARDADLRLHEIEVGEKLGDSVLDLQTRIDLEKVERLVTARRDHEILAGRHSSVFGLAKQADRRFAKLVHERLREPRRRSLFDHLLVLALHRAVAQSEREHRSVAVGRHLHLDVARTRNRLLDEERAVAEGIRSLGLRAVECGGQVVALAKHPDAATAAARGRLQHDGETDALGEIRQLESLHGSAAPRRHGNTARPRRCACS